MPGVSTRRGTTPAHWTNCGRRPAGSRTCWTQSPTRLSRACLLRATLAPLADRRPSYLPAIGRFLIVVTFLEDALRIITQWNDQLTYLHDYRHCMLPASVRPLPE